MQPHIPAFVRIPSDHPVSLGVTSTLFASVVAAYTWFHVDYSYLSVFCSQGHARGANIDNALALVFVGGLAASALILLTRKQRRLLDAVLVAAVAVLSVAIVLVALDSVTYIQYSTCFGQQAKDANNSAHVDYLYVLWGVPLAVLVACASFGLIVERSR